MEDILSRLLVADTNVVEQATVELKQAFKKTDSTAELFQLLLNSQKPMIRQYAAILLRERYSKIKNWKQLPEDVRARAKEISVQGVVQESEVNVRNSIAQLIGTIVKHELSNNGWPQIFQIIQELATSEDASKKELAMYMLSKMTEIAPDAYIVHAESIMNLLTQVMQRLEESRTMTAYYVLKTMLNLVPLVNGNSVMVNGYHLMMVPAMGVVQALATSNEDKAIDSMELFDELCEQAITVLAPRVKDLVAMCLAIAKNTSFGDDLRSRAINLLRTLIRTKKKAIVKHKIVEPIVDVLFELMSVKPDGEDVDEDFFVDENEEQSPAMHATHTMHLLGLHLQPEKLMPHVLTRIKPGIDGNDIHAKKAAYLTMAVLAEGCSEHIRSNYLSDFLQCVKSGIMHESPIVRNSALYAAGKFSEYLQPDISQFSEELMPVLSHYLERIYEYTDQEDGVPRGVIQMFYALEIFCENLGDALLPYLPNLMQRLIDYLNKGTSLQLRGLVFSAIGAAANASKEHMLPYLSDIMSHLDRHLSEKQTKETMPLQIQAIETLGILIRSIGGENLNTVIGRSLEFGLNLLKETNDPDVRKVLYGLFASISTVMKKEMAPALALIVEAIIESIHSTEGVVSRYKDEDVENFFPLHHDISDSENEDEEDIENTDNEDDIDDEYIAGHMVTNSYIEEKEEAILALREIAQYTEEAFLPYLEKSFEETFRIVHYPQVDVREAAIDALLQFCINLSKINTNEGREALLKALSVFVPKLSELIRLDNERAVAINGLGAYAALLKEVKADVIVGEGHRDAILNSVHDIMTEKTECQDHEEADGDSCENEAEEDEQLIEYAGDVFSALGKVIPPYNFAVFFNMTLPILQDRCKSNRTEAQKSFAVGTLAECISGLKYTSADFVEQLLPLFHKCSSDESPEVRNNAFYGLGELILHSKEAMYPHYSNILSVIVVASARENHAGPRDNMIGVIARMIIANYSIIDIDQVFPSFVKQLPLEQDFEEYQAVFNAILTLYRAGHEIVKPHLQDLLKLAITVLHEDKAPNDETKEIVVEFIKSVNRDFSDIYNAVHAQLPAEVSANMLRLFS